MKDNGIKILFLNVRNHGHRKVLNIGVGVGARFRILGGGGKGVGVNFSLVVN